MDDNMPLKTVAVSKLSFSRVSKYFTSRKNYIGL
jgi:hypothetical protein